MPEAPPITEADILQHVVSPDRADLDPAAARAMLMLRFDDSAMERIRVLIRRNQDGDLSGEEQDELQKYLRVGHFLDLLHAKAYLVVQS